jgi:hypothetical protein
MFKITEETKAAAIEAMKAILGDLPEEKLSEAFDAAVEQVKKQFGM